MYVCKPMQVKRVGTTDQGRFYEVAQGGTVPYENAAPSPVAPLMKLVAR